MNGFKVTLMMIALMVLFMWLGYLFGGQNGMILAFAVASVMNFFSYWFSDRIVLRLYRARQVGPGDHPMLHRVVQNVANKAMMPMPKTYIIPSKAANAFATGRNVDHAAVAVTEGLLAILSEEELEGVIGHEIGHITNKDILIGTIAATFAGAIGIIASIARWGAIFGGYARDNDRGGGIGLLLTAIVAPLMAMLIQMAISRQREYRADERSAEITGRPLDLASALKKLHAPQNRLRLDSKPATAHMMIASPLSGRGFSSLFSTHPPVEKRIAALERLARSPVSI
jgi:heat shock protein HtpX